MKYLNKWFVSLWALLLILIGLISLSTARVCWDGFKHNEEFLQQKCQVTLDQYLAQMQVNPDFCPEALEPEARLPAGGCYADWRTILINLVLISLIFNGLYFIYYLQKTKPSRPQQ